MRFWGEIKLRWCTPASDFYVVIGAVTNRNPSVRQVGNAGQNLSQPRVQIRSRSFQLRDSLPQCLRMRRCCAGILPAFFLLGNFFGRLVALRFAGFSLSDGMPPLRIDLAEVH